MTKSDIGILFDVSGSMQSPFNSFDFHNSYNKSNELLNMIDRICSKGNRLENEKIRVFCILFGGTSELIYDFGNLIDISNRKFKHPLSSSQNSKASKYGYGKRLQQILSENNSKSLYLDNYLYSETGPSERLCEMVCYILEDDPYLRERIYNELPNECKSFLKDMGVSGVSFFGFYSKEKNKATTDEIDKIYRTIINECASKIIQEEISQRKYNGNKIKFIDGNDLVNMKNNLEGKLTSPNNKSLSIIDIFKDYIYGNTPLYTALNLAFDNFKIQSANNKKFLFIISDGELNDISKNFDYISEIKKKENENQVMIISIFLTTNSIPKEQTLYDELQSNFTNGSKDLFLMSSTLTYENPVIKFLIEKGWNIPRSGECKLFVEINNSQNLNKFIELMNEAIGELNYKNNKEVSNNPNSLMSLLSSTIANDYVNSEINKNEAKKQSGLTCYANAIAATICFSSAKVLGRDKLKFSEVRKNIIDKYGENGNLMDVLNNILGHYRLKYKMEEEEGARKAVMKTRPCLAVFELSGMQWGDFKKFFKNTPKGILTKKIVNENNNYPGEKDEAHSVVLTHISKKYLKCLNSWGTEWGDNGYFRIENADVLNMEFIDIFWKISDLNNKEKEYFNKYNQNLRKSINSYIFSE